MPLPAKVFAENSVDWGAIVYEKFVAGWIATLLMGAATTGVWAADVSPVERSALMLPVPQAAATLGIATAGKRLVAVGERGVILLSDDKGKQWRQANSPVSVTLTAVRFVDAQTGFVTGHSGVVLATSDGGEHWSRVLDGKKAADLTLVAAQSTVQRLGNDDPTAKRALAVANRLVADGADKPFLDLYFADARRGFVVGAYGIAYQTADGGKTWSSKLDRLDNPKGLHLNAIAGSGSRIVIAGEQGLLLVSDDGGGQFSRVETPYRGSWFALEVGASGSMVLGGLRGNLYFSEGAAAGWTKVPIDAQASITALARSADGRLYAGNQGGQIFVSRDGGRSFSTSAFRAAPPLAAVASEGAGLVVAGLRGVQLLDAPSTIGKGATP